MSLIIGFSRSPEDVIEICSICEGISDLNEPNWNKNWIGCRCCAHVYHRNCMLMAGLGDWVPLRAVYDPTELQADPLWCCSSCRECEQCEQSGAKSFEQCYFCYKTYCDLCTQLLSHSKLWTGYYWCCSDCVPKCINCFCKLTTERAEESRFCRPCLVARIKGDFCPVCERAYTEESDEGSMVMCDKCDKWVHYQCTGLSTAEKASLSRKNKFVCRECDPFPRLSPVDCIACSADPYCTDIRSPMVIVKTQKGSVSLWSHKCCLPLSNFLIKNNNLALSKASYFQSGNMRYCIDGNFFEFKSWEYILLHNKIVRRKRLSWIITLNPLSITIRNFTLTADDIDGITFHYY